MPDYYFKLFFIIFFLLQIIKSEKDCSSCTPSDPSNDAEPKCTGEGENCDKDCMWLNTAPNEYKCLSCDGINDGESKYYSKGITVEGKTYCHKIGLSGFKNKKIIYNTKQIVSNCFDLGLYELGDVCYHTNPDINNIEIKNEIKKLYKCKYYNYKIREQDNKDKNELIYYQCLSENEMCPPELNYIDIETKECFNSCPNGKTKITEIIETVEGQEYTLYGCLSSCAGEYDKTLDKKPFFCYKNCPEEAKYFYSSDKKCLEYCSKSNKDFSNSEYECLNDKSKCTSKSFLINKNKNYFHCENSEITNCPTEYPFKYTKDGYTYCLTTCDDTNIPFFNNIKTYLYTENVCTDIRPDINYYKDEIGKQWVTDCLNANSGPLHEGENCVKKCSSTNQYLVEDTNECINTCDTNNYYIDEETKTCVKNCPSHLERGFYDSNKKCVKCGIDGTGNGFHTENGKECLTSCDGYKYNYQNNICFESSQGCSKDGYKYSALDKNNICYKSCADIDGGIYKYEINLICYKDKPTSTEVSNINNYYFYKNTNGIYKYILGTQAIKTCFELGLKYLKDSECIQDCATNEYKVYPTAESFGLCFSSCEECKENSYYCYNDKICKSECNLKDSDEHFIENNNICLDTCPTGYPYENNKICYQKCPSGYYKEIENKKICQDSCPYYYIEADSTKKCLDKCINGYDSNGIPTFLNYYIDASTSQNICVDQCPTTNPNNPFVLEAINGPKLCSDSCPDEAPYYYDTNKICLKQCNKYYDGKKCVDTCNNFIYMGNQCLTTCPYDAPFYIQKTEDSTTIKECVTSCVENGYNYYNSEKKCTNDLNDYIIFNGGLVNLCPTNLVTEDSKCKKPPDWTYFTITENTASNLGSCETYITTSYECVTKCPLGENFVKENDNNCLTKCDGDTPYYKKLEDYGTEYAIYQCIGLSEFSSCLHIDNKKQCLNDCGNLFKDNNICKTNCGEKFSMFTKDDKHICKDSCDYPYYGNEKICDTECSFSTKRIKDEGTNQCVDKCDKNTDYKFLTLIDDKLHCTNNCATTNSNYKRFLSSNNICISKCPPSTYVDEDTGECTSTCPDTKKIKLVDNEYICTSTCPTEGDKYYYINSQLCLSSCYPGDYVIKDTNICTKSCTDTQDQKIYFYDSYSSSSSYEFSCVSSCSSTNKPYSRENNHCDNSCDTDTSGDFYYDNTDKICKKNCDDGKTDGDLCKTSCETKYEDKNGICMNQCTSSISGYIYHKENEYLCRNICPEGTFLYDNVCYESCSTTVNKYTYDNYCAPNCLKDKSYYIDTEKKCLDDCPPTAPYFTITKATSNTPDLFVCTETCSAYVQNPDTSKNSKLCLGNDCNGAYPYYITETINTKDIKHCYTECPQGYFYIELKNSNNEGIECLPSCDGDLPYHFINDYKCISLSDCEFFDLSQKICVYSCSQEQYIYETQSLTYCLNKCSDYTEKTLYLNYEKKCVENCKANYEKINTETNECECENLFIIDKIRGIKTCLNKEENTCEKQIDYPYLIEEEKQCSDKCDGIISLDGTICHKSDYTCPENSKIVKVNGYNQCVCIDKYYYITSFQKDIICLPENSKCIRNEAINRELLITETNECVEYCPFDKYYKKYGKTCINLCPLMSIVVNDECFCPDKWYMDENDEMICCEECPSERPIMIDETKECVSTCKNTEYLYYYQNKCYKDCSELTETKQIDDISKANTDDYIGFYLPELYGKYGDKMCYCKGAWYDEGNENGCDKSEEPKACNAFDNIFSYKYTVLPTYQCVKECPEYFEYYFNEYCFSSCEDGNTLLKNKGDNYSNEQLKTQDNSKECKCNNLWRYNEEDPLKIQCISEDNCPTGTLLIVENKECYKGTQCNEKNPLLYNNKCYNQNNCPENTAYKSDFPKTCSCVKYFYINENNDDIICLGQNESCPTEYPNLIYSRNKCVKNDDEELENLKKFNGIYYNNCPKYTMYDEEKEICVCNKLYGYWYQDDEPEKNLHCAETSCNEEKPSLLINTMECISSCNLGDKKYVEYNGICYEECPELTKENENGICELQQISDTKNSTEFAKVLTDNIVSLYQISRKDDTDNENENDEDDSKIIDLVNSNLTVEFYGVSKNKKENKLKHNNKNKTSSSLSYIDLSECIQDLYESNNMLPDDEIIILKFDKKETPIDYLINPVEYKFLNSRNGQELDASICAKGGIKISYPFSNIIMNYEKLSTHKHNSRLRNLKYTMLNLNNVNDLNTLIEKYNVGKEIYEEYSNIDTFNKKDNIYTDYCISVEINGKDLILEDRSKYLLPHYSLCEDNCTYNHTDFEEDRIYCDCTFKNVFDLNREHESNIDINENEIIQSQDGESNFPVLKCISVLSDSKRIKNNIGFYYMLIIIIIEIVFLILLILFGYKSFKLFFSDKICDNDITDNYIEQEKLDINEKISDNKNEFDEIIKTTQRLNAPPKRSNNENDNNEIDFIPEEFLFLYFNDGDKGVRKKVEKNMLPFTVKENAKVLLQKMENVDYTNVKANGPFHEEQNLIEIDGGVEENVNFNVESINESLFDNNGNIQEKNIKEKGKELETVSEEKVYKRKNVNNYKINEFDEIELEKNKGKEINLYTEIKIEQRLLKKYYEFVKDKYDTDLYVIILAEILDKIYLTKIILFQRKYEIMFLNLSVYILYHVFLLNLIAMFYNIKTIKNIWNKENYPGFGLHLGYGLLTLIITWIIYIIINCLLTNKGKYNEIINIKKSKKKEKEKKIELINKKYKSLISKMKTKLIAYYIIQFILIIFFFIYLVTLGAVYSGTMKRIFLTYGITLLEALIIKMIYGLVLGILRHISLSNKNSKIYNVILIFDKYIV